MDAKSCVAVVAAHNNEPRFNSPLSIERVAKWVVFTVLPRGPQRHVQYDTARHARSQCLTTVEHWPLFTKRIKCDSDMLIFRVAVTLRRVLTVRAFSDPSDIKIIFLWVDPRAFLRCDLTILYFMHI